MIPRLLMALFALALIVVPGTSNAQSSTAAKPTCAAGDPVVWVNTSSHVYHLQGDKYYGTTKSGDYECESKAIAGGAHKSGTGSKPKTAASAPAMSAGTSAPSASPSPAAKKKKHHTPAASPTP